MPLPLLFVIGDSISLQYGPYLASYVEGRFAYSRKCDEGEALLNLDRPQGSNGGDSSMVREYLTGLQASGVFHPDLLLLNCGLHDIKTDPSSGAQQIPLPQYRENLRAILALIRALDIRLLWVRTTPVEDARHNTLNAEFHRHQSDVDAYNAAADEIMREAGVPLLDLHTFTRTLGEDIYCDHVHFTEAVRQLQGAYIAGYVSAMAPPPS